MMRNHIAEAAAWRALPARLIALAAAVGAAVPCAAAEPAAATPAGNPAAASPAADSQLVPAALPPWARSSRTGPAASPTAPIAAAPQNQAAPIVKTEPSAPLPAVADTGSTVPPGSGQDDKTLLQSPLTVVRWGFSAIAQPDGSGGFSIIAQAGRPLQLWLTIEGGQNAVDRLRAAGRLAINVHWERADKSAGPSAPDLNTELTVGRPGLAATFAEQVQRQGHFEWHLWSRKDALSPGQWIVSLTYPDGAPVKCGQAAPRACRLAISAG